MSQRQWGPTCYIDDDGYRGGFTADDIEELWGSLDSNYLGWSSAMAPVITGNPERPEMGKELTNGFCATDPDMAAVFARTTFLSDKRLLQQAQATADAAGEIDWDVLVDSTVVRAHQHAPARSGPPGPQRTGLRCSSCGAFWQSLFLFTD